MILSLLDCEDARILDIATGTGRFAETLTEEGKEVVGIDASSHMLSKGGADCVQGDALKLPFRGKTFDATISMRFFHLLSKKDIKPFIEEVERVTEHKFIFDTLHPFSLRLMYQWALPQRSRMYSNSFLKEVFDGIEVVKRVENHHSFLVPYGIYQCLPLGVAETVNTVDEEIIDRYSWLASTVYWELFFS